MVGELERFRERLRGKPQEARKFQAKDGLAITLSVTALIWSIGSSYWKDFRTVDDVRVSLGFDWPRLDVKDARHAVIYARQNLTFTNAGTRATAITTAHLLVGVPREGERNGCSRDYGFTPGVLAYDLEPFVIRPGEILIKEIRLKDGQPFARNEKGEVSVELQVQRFPADIQFNSCLQLNLLTPDNYAQLVEVPLAVYEYKQNFQGAMAGHGVTFPRTPVPLWKDR